MARLRSGLLTGRVEREVWKELRASGDYVVHTKPRLTDVIDADDANWRGVPISPRALAILAFELAEYKALQKLDAWHKAQQTST